MKIKYELTYTVTGETEINEENYPGLDHPEQAFDQEVNQEEEVVWDSFHDVIAGNGPDSYKFTYQLIDGDEVVNERVVTS